MALMILYLYLWLIICLFQLEPIQNMKFHIIPFNIEAFFVFKCISISDRKFNLKKKEILKIKSRNFELVYLDWLFSYKVETNRQLKRQKSFCQNQVCLSFAKINLIEKNKLNADNRNENKSNSLLQLVIFNYFTLATNISRFV